MSPSRARGALRRTPQIMQAVLLALLPGVLALLLCFGVGVLLQLLMAVAACLATEALCLRCRGQNPRLALSDYSAWVTGMLIGIAMPPLAPAWVTVLAAAGGVGLGKHLYGGLGQNPFNPAMVGYALALVTAPLAMTTWLLPQQISGELPGIMEVFSAVFGNPAPSLDAYTGATVLDAFRHREAQTVAEFWRDSALVQAFAGHGWLWVNLAFLLGGLGLLALRIVRWHAPAGMLTAIALSSLMLWDSGSTASAGGPLMHLFSGATMLGAFFIVTDPVSGAATARGRLLFGAGVGTLVMIIRTWGGYPDGVAFAVLIMNMTVPWLDAATRPLPATPARDSSS